MNFGKRLTKVREKAKVTTYRLAEDAQTNWIYVKRLETGERKHPSRKMVLRLGQALLDNSGAITLDDVDRLLKAAGYGPLPRNRVSIVDLRR